MIVASLYQMPVDPFGEVSGHRPLDYWGRNMVDHFVRLCPPPRRRGSRLPDAALDHLAAQDRRAAQLLGLEGRAADFGFFFFSDVFEENAAQIRRVEQLSDAYHVSLAGEDVMVAYLVEITRKA